MKKQVHVYYSGRVQGVGFRFSAEDIARQLNVTGWAKNLHDEKVEIVAEAEEEVLKSFLEEINKTFSRYIADSEVEWLPATGKFRDLEINQ